MKLIFININYNVCKTETQVNYERVRLPPWVTENWYDKCSKKEKEKVRYNKFANL